jgi:hypothetical protein
MLILFFSPWRQPLSAYRFLPSTCASLPRQKPCFTSASFTSRSLSLLDWQYHTSLRYYFDAGSYAISPTKDAFVPCPKCNSPVKAEYDFNPPSSYPNYPYRCTNREMILFTGSLVSTILDFWIMLVPIPLAWQLDLPLNQRLGALGMFLLGLLICACGAVKTGYLYTLFSTYDEIWVGTPIWILSALELHIGILCSSAPTIRLVLREHIKRFHGWFHSRGYHYARTDSLTSSVPHGTSGSYYV